MNSIMGQIAPEQLKLFALELGKIATFDFVYSLASANISQSAPNLVTTGFSINPRPIDIVCLLLGPVGLDPPDTSPTGRPNFISTFVLYKFIRL